MSKSRVIAQYTRYLRVIATIEQVERPRLARRLASAHRSLAKLHVLTHLNESLVDRLRLEADKRLARNHNPRS